MIKSLLLISLLCLKINIAHSEVYRWTDENGKTVYGDKPTSSDADKVTIKKKPKPDKAYQERVEKQKKLLGVIKEERNEVIAKKTKEKEEKEKQEKECSKLKKELEEMRIASHLYDETDDPNNPRIYTDEERKVEEEKFRDHIKENCG